MTQRPLAARSRRGEINGRQEVLGLLGVDTELSGGWEWTIVAPLYPTRKPPERPFGRGACRQKSLGVPGYFRYNRRGREGERPLHGGGAT